jgi:hypothetical protein
MQQQVNVFMYWGQCDQWLACREGNRGHYPSDFWSSFFLPTCAGGCFVVPTIIIPPCSHLFHSMSWWLLHSHLTFRFLPLPGDFFLLWVFIPTLLALMTPLNLPPISWWLLHQWPLTNILLPTSPRHTDYSNSPQGLNSWFGSSLLSQQAEHWSHCPLFIWVHLLQHSSWTAWSLRMGPNVFHNISNKLSTYTLQHPRRVMTSTAPWWKFEILHGQYWFWNLLICRNCITM